MTEPTIPAFTQGDKVRIIDPARGEAPEPGDPSVGIDLAFAELQEGVEGVVTEKRWANPFWGLLYEVEFTGNFSPSITVWVKPGNVEIIEEQA